ncbi:protein NRT1/ PTR FAMILY 4.4-like isoform X2 [Miscanthus floridulus]|uniref:protein NRT1/ PTR FAMILY 4.4-like isoform X2 n=1 Tax=Miscanthus floridulus TaxID=154761 RepID=UPI00345B3DB5
MHVDAGIQAFEMMAIAAVGNNLITYVFGEMHFPLSEAANIVTNFIGTVFLLSLLGGFLSDSYLGSFWTMLIFGFIELSGFILLAVQAHLPQLRPPLCDMMSATAGQQACEQASGLKAGIFFAALYLVALGSGCLKPNIIAHGADQFRRGGGGGDARRLSSYFNAAYFSFCVGELVALTVLVWVQTCSGMDVGFGVSAAAMAIGLLSLVAGIAFYRNKPPHGSIFTPIAKVFVAAVSKRKQVCPSTASVKAIATVTVHDISVNTTDICHISKIRFLDKACVKAPDSPGGSSAAGKAESPWRLCTPAEVEQVKLLLCVVPILACTIVFNTILAQLQTFSVQQGSAMDTRLAASGFHVPPASLQAIPYVMLVALVPAYEAAFVPAMRRVTGVATGITPLQRIGVGLFAVTFSMVAAALVEARRRHAAAGGRLLSIFWIAPQFLVFGLSEMFTAVGLIEFFYKQSLDGMQAFLTSMTYCSYSFGFYLSSVLVSLVNRITSSSAAGNGGWLANNDLNKDRLDLFYWLLAALSILNFFNYLFWARWYSKSVETVQVVGVGSGGGEQQDDKDTPEC